MRSADIPRSRHPGGRALAPFAAALFGACLCFAQTGPLQPPRPNPIGGEIIHGLSANGFISGLGLSQSNPLSGDKGAQAALSNGQLLLQKTDGWWQFYVLAGAYDIPALGAPFVSTEDTVTQLYGPVPVAYLKLAPAKDTSILIGALPTLMGAEGIFTFQNMNVERGLLWVQENTVNRGVQVNQKIGNLTASLSWNDGFYSNRYSWLAGSLSYASGPHTLSFQAMGNLRRTAFRTLATPVQNNGSMYALVYTCSKGRWNVQPYAQYTGVQKAASTRGAALLISRGLSRRFSVAGRAEYLRSAGALNLLYGPGSAAWSATVTPTYQYGPFFVRADLAVVRVNRETPGYAFGAGGVSRNQARAVIEAGVLF